MQAMWIGFAIIVAISLAIDLVGHRGTESRAVSLAWSLLWIGVSCGFGAWIWIALGQDKAEDFATAYLIEKALSVDNLFVFLLIFGQLKLSTHDQHRVLFWGIFGALCFRAAFIAGGAAALERWHEIVYVLGGFLVLTAIKTVRGGESKGGILRFARERLKIRSTFVLAIVAIELTDVMFAIDSVPAVFSISSDPFIVYTSNVFAILGLRALYFVLSDLLGRLRYMHYGLAAVLLLAGAKMLTSGIYHPPHILSLAAIALVLVVTIGASLWKRG